MRDIAKQLVECGLSSLQARVYVALLQLGDSQASEIAKAAAVNRVTCYTALEELQQLKLVIVDEKDVIKEFRVLPLHHLEDLFIERAKQATAAYRHIQALIPDLQKLAKHEIADPHTVYREGEVAVRRYIKDELFGAHVEAMYVSNSRHYDLIKELVKRNMDYGMRPRVISPHSVMPSLLTYLDHRVVPSRIAQFPTTTLIFHDRVAILLEDNNFLQIFVMVDKRIQEHYKAHFELQWKMLSGSHIVIPKSD